MAFCHHHLFCSFYDAGSRLPRLTVLEVFTGSYMSEDFFVFWGTGTAWPPTADGCRIYSVDCWTCGETAMINETRCDIRFNIFPMYVFGVFKLFQMEFCRRRQQNFFG